MEMSLVNLIAAEGGRGAKTLISLSRLISCSPSNLAHARLQSGTLSHDQHLVLNIKHQDNGLNTAPPTEEKSMEPKIRERGLTLDKSQIPIRPPRSDVIQLCFAFGLEG